MSKEQKPLVWKRLGVALALASLSVSAWAVPIQTLPDTLVNAAKACRVDPKAVTLSVVPLKGLVVPEGAPMPQVEPLIAVNGDRHVAPASTAKLVTTLAGLELSLIHI